MSDSFHQLTDADLEALATALRTRRLSPPYSEVAARRSCSAENAGVVTDQLQELNRQGMQPDHLALLLESILRARRQNVAEEDLIDLVWTGPETSATLNRDTPVVVRDLFGRAEHSVLVAGFAVYHGREVFARLAERMSERPSLHVRMLLNVHRRPGDNSSCSEVVHRFADDFFKKEWPDCGRMPQVFYDPRSLEFDPAKRASLHAKCIVVDRRIAFVTSANFTEAAQSRNIEVGVLINSVAFAIRLEDHFASLVTEDHLLEVPF
jgi:phosphatidylserine/phosphatidylglycerophosphate/cardiolipin synthase-like enzyme